MRSRSSTKRVRIDEENPYWMSFSDLMSGLLVVFLLASVALIIQLTEARVNFEQEMQEKRRELAKEQEAAKRHQQEALRLKAALQKREQELEKIREELRLAKLKIREDIEQLRQAEKIRREVLYTIKESLAKQNIVVEVVDNDSVLRIPETTLSFLSNSYDIPDNAATQKAIAQIGLALHQAITEPASGLANNRKRFDYLDTIFIEGHTDSRPTNRTKGNWGLSTFRAISLWEFWQDQLAVSPPFADMENTFKQKLFSVSGYAASRRLQMVEDTAEQREMNRRIDLRITVKRPSIEDLENIIKP